MLPEHVNGLWPTNQGPIAPQNISPRTNEKKQHALLLVFIYGSQPFVWDMTDWLYIALRHLPPVWEPAFCLGYDRLVVHCLEAFTTGQMGKTKTHCIKQKNKTHFIKQK